MGFNRTIGYITLIAGLSLLITSGSHIYFKKIHGYGYRTAYSDDIGNLKLDNKLKVAGVEIGQVAELSREGNKAKIRLRMRTDIPIRSGYILQNRDYGLMGDRALFLDPGQTGDPLPLDSPLTVEFVPGIAEGIRNADSLEVIVTRLRSLVQSFSRVDPKNDSLFTTQLNKVLLALDRASFRLDKMLTDNEPAVTRTINRTHDFSGTLRTSLSSLKPKAEKTIAQTATLSKDALKLIDKIGPPLDSLNVLLEMTVDGKNLAGKAVADKNLYPQLVASIKKIRAVLAALKEDGVKLDIDFF